VLKVLQERDYIRVTGRADRLGAPVLYGTTKQFLDTFGMKDIQELPERDDIIKTFKDKLQKPSNKKESENSEDAQKN
jgi:chromosome segregation and condensation protein ScpB